VKEGIILLAHGHFPVGIEESRAVGGRKRRNGCDGSTKVESSSRNFVASFGSGLHCVGIIGDRGRDGL
jgi:hypothetical protein